jgi:ABC-type ATPase with predicted acetyltransferase domain
LIDYFADKWGIDNSISALNQVGLSEAFIYLKPYKFLSRGQQYRARLAEIILVGKPVWLIDEFCSDLDPFTAKIVASNLRKHVIKYRSN